MRPLEPAAGVLFHGDGACDQIDVLAPAQRLDLSNAQTQRLREYLVKGFTLDDERLKRGRPATTRRAARAHRDIPASEKAFWRKVRDMRSERRSVAAVLRDGPEQDALGSTARRSGTRSALVAIATNSRYVSASP